jgi:hypothetical protein
MGFVMMSSTDNAAHAPNKSIVGTGKSLYAT